MLPDRVVLLHDSTGGAEVVGAPFAAHADELHRHDDWLVDVSNDAVQDFQCCGVRRCSHALWARG
jgi:hypothetical protein